MNRRAFIGTSVLAALVAGVAGAASYLGTPTTTAKHSGCCGSCVEACACCTGGACACDGCDCSCSDACNGCDAPKDRGACPGHAAQSTPSGCCAG